MLKRVGLTMRVAEISGYNETRDCLAQDWYSFIAYALPKVIWMLIPNMGDKVGDYIHRWKLDGFILTGGNSICDSTIRDQTETALLDYAIYNQLPVFGVCRGLQMIQHYYEGKNSKCSSKGHVGTTHLVNIIDTPWNLCTDTTEEYVNSYHNQAVYLDELANPLKPMAVSEDGLVEALFANEHIVAVQWHPERRQIFSKFDRDLVQKTFKLDSLR